MEIYRQGDVLIKRRRTAPKSDNLAPVARDDGRVILAYGEVTGHAHALTEPKIDMFEDTATNQRFMHIMQVSNLVHEEHSTIELRPGWYEVIRQREYEPGPARQRWVAD